VRKADQPNLRVSLELATVLGIGYIYIWTCETLAYRSRKAYDLDENVRL
jgi:hypothetical protein